MSDVTSAPIHTTPVRTPRLAWPPPGLEAIQGKAWPIVVEFCIGGAILALPLLFAVATPQPFWSLGVFGRSWWIPIASTILAFLILSSATWRLARLLQAAAAASSLGYGIGTITIAATDDRKDSGFVLQGARQYSTLPANERRALLFARLLGVSGYLAAALWVPLGLALSLLFASNGAFGDSALWTLTLLPAAVLMVLATCARIVEHMAMRRARKLASGIEPTLREEAREWTDNLDIVADDVAIASRTNVRPRNLKLAALAVTIPAILLLVPLTMIVASSAIGPVIASISVPRISKVLEKFAVANAMRGYRLPIDSSITPEAAGNAFNNLSQVGTPKLYDFMKPALVKYPDWPKAPPGWDVTMLSDGMFERVKKGDLKPEERAYLAQVAAHPSHAEYAVLAHAAHADLLGGRTAGALPDTLSAFEIPIPRFGHIRESAYLHAGKAAYEFSQGRNADAERTLKEIVSTGALMMDEGPTLIEGLIGNVIMGIGTYDLEEFYRAAGRTAEADAMKTKHDAAEQAAEYVHLVDPDVSLTPSALQSITAIVTNPGMPRGVRWEYLIAFNNFAPCLNLQNVVLGTGTDYKAWLATARSSLVRYPREAELFDIARSGLLGSPAHPTSGCLPGNSLRRTVDLVNAVN